MKLALRLARAAALAVLASSLIALPATAQNRDDDKSATQDVKDAGHATKEATKKTGTNIKKGTKKVVHKSAQKTGEGARKVEDKTAPKD